MTPPFFASAFNWSSSRLRSLFATAVQPECDSMIGAFDTAIASQNDLVDACDKSTIMPEPVHLGHRLLAQVGQALVARPWSPTKSASWLFAV